MEQGSDWKGRVIMVGIGEERRYEEQRGRAMRGAERKRKGKVIKAGYGLERNGGERKGSEWPARVRIGRARLVPKM